MTPVVCFFDGIAEALGARTFALGLSAYRESTAEYLGFEPQTMEFVRWLWGLDFDGSRALTYRVTQERLLDPSGERRPSANDGRDAEHGFAAPFVEILVHEGAHFEIARKAAKEAGLDCKVFNGRSKANPLGTVARGDRELALRGTRRVWPPIRQIGPAQAGRRITQRNVRHRAGVEVGTTDRRCSGPIASSDNSELGVPGSAQTEFWCRASGRGGLPDARPARGESNGVTEAPHVA